MAGAAASFDREAVPVVVGAVFEAPKVHGVAVIGRRSPG